MRMPRARWPTLLLAAMGVAAVAGPLLFYHQKLDSAAAASQQEAVLSLRQLVAELKELARAIPGSGAGGSGDRQQWEELQAQFTNLRADFERQVQQLVAVQGGLQDFTNTVTLELGQQAGLRRGAAAAAAAGGGALERVAGEPSVVQRLDSQGQYLASPSIVKLKDGRLLAVYEQSLPWGTGNTTMKSVAASEDGGASWREIATVGPMNWPQIFRCKSGVYIIGTQRHFSRDNNLVISRMLATDATKWSEPAQLTRGLSVVAANTGVDISGGRITKSFELIPGMASPPAATVLLKEVEVPIQGGPEGPSWRHQPVLTVEVQDVRGFVQYTLVTAPLGDRALFFRVLEVRPEAHALDLRLERFNLYWQREPVTLPANNALTVASGANVYGGVDWVAMAMSAEEDADLTRPESWVVADPPLGNPASVYSNELRALFDVAFRADADVRKSIIGFDVEALNSDPETAWEAGFGSVYWMEGVITRLQDRHGGNGRLLSIMRVNNDLLCDLAAVLEFDDSQPGRLAGRFLRYTFVPGLGVGHPAIVYDEESDLYWMATNVNRDSTRKWQQPREPTDAQPHLHITAFSKCEVDRSTMALFYSPNLFNWVWAGVIDYHVSLARHFTYPHMIIDGSDLLIISRASFSPGTRSPSAGLNQFYNNHNSNSIALHRVRDFRALADAEWANEQGEYSEHPRRSTTLDDMAIDAARATAEQEAQKAAAGRQKPSARFDAKLLSQRWRDRATNRGLGRWAEAHLKFKQAAQQAQQEGEEAARQQAQQELDAAAAQQAEQAQQEQGPA